MKENKGVTASQTAPNLFIQLPSLSAVTLFRIAFGIVWLVDGAQKILWLQPSTPTTFLHGIGLIELFLGCALVLGFLRKSAYLCGIMLSLMIWSIVEGFGGPYGPGSTDVGAAIMYAFIFFAIIVVERSSNYNRYSLDVLIERKLNGWKHLAEFYEDKRPPTRPDEL